MWHRPYVRSADHLSISALLLSIFATHHFYQGPLHRMVLPCGFTVVSCEYRFAPVASDTNVGCGAGVVVVSLEVWRSLVDILC
jgi:hypothetical protein